MNSTIPVDCTVDLALQEPTGELISERDLVSVFGSLTLTEGSATRLKQIVRLALPSMSARNLVKLVEEKERLGDKSWAWLRPEVITLLQKRLVALLPVATSSN